MFYDRTGIETTEEIRRHLAFALDSVIHLERGVALCCLQVSDPDQLRELGVAKTAILKARDLISTTTDLVEFTEQIARLSLPSSESATRSGTVTLIALILKARELTRFESMMERLAPPMIPVTDGKTK